MPIFSNILVPVDFSEPSERAFKLALLFARPQGATVHLMHDIELPTETITGATIIREEMEKAYARSNQKMQELEQLPEAAEVRVNRVILKSTDPKRSILTFAEENEMDLIVMGTHGRTDPLEEIIGSTAERVLRRSSCPIITVRAECPVDRLSHILVPVDFSEYSQRAVEHAAHVAEAHDARLTVLHAGADEPVDDGRRLRELVNEARLDGRPADVVVSTDDVDDAILRVADDREADLVLMITHGRTGLRRALTRSVAESVVRKASCPVMTYRTALED